MIKNLILHFNLVNKHRFKVFKLCVKAGIPFRGLVHDLSKYSPVEFFESAKYYNGKFSPISTCKKENGYSKVGYTIKVEINIITNIGMIIWLQKKQP